ncbi:hypothetical protein K490DRAFT_67404 [Saccharata proteae CBS 121410]|uniref:BTB domain-containing protein n=1 Tax=Saccharata proteae CBS 121410 TaxID=1314787 RepID=A0A9P4HUE6_9PEZI|nr:hypothetical protein K490DRAFT_67404 [Saccharata proteae CBS 121410]
MAETQPHQDSPSQNKPEKPLHELLSHALVDIYVGPSSTHWILHEKLLCARSKFFQKIFYNNAKTDNSKSSSSTSSFGLPDDEDEPFAAFVAWLYSSNVKAPAKESDLTILFDMYLMGEKWAAPALTRDVLHAVRDWYARTDTYPGLRRVQYIYANTDESSPMRRLLVHSVARMMALADSIPQHWDKALRKNGQLAVDLIKSIQEWRIAEESVPDARREMEEVAGVKAERKEEVKSVEKEAEKGAERKDGKEGEQQKTNGVNGAHDEGEKDIKKEPEEKLTNGVNGHHHDDDDDDNE